MFGNNIYSAAADRMRNLNVPNDEKKDSTSKEKTIETKIDAKKSNNKRIQFKKSEVKTERVKTTIDTYVAVAHKMRDIDPSAHQTMDFKKLLGRFKKEKD